MSFLRRTDFTPSSITASSRAEEYKSDNYKSDKENIKKQGQKKCPCFSLLINLKFNFLCGEKPHSVFPATGASEKHLVSENLLNKRVFKGTGVVLAGIECSPKIFDFRANGIPVQERVDFFDTLKAGAEKMSLLFYKYCLTNNTMRDIV